MAKKDVIYRNPLRLLGGDDSTLLPPGGFGAISSRAGVGKTALLVQIALERMLHNHDVVHLSLGDPIDKVKLWYKQVLNGLCSFYEKQQVQALWEEAAPHRLIMTFNVGEFSVPHFEERLHDLTEQNIISPQVLLVDGLNFDTNVKQTLGELKEMAQKFGLRVWFAVRTHRHENANESGIPAALSQVVDLFDTVIDLQPQDGDIHVTLVKGGAEDTQRKPLVLDPPTMLVKNKEA